jgi:hypothetical protein
MAIVKSRNTYYLVEYTGIKNGKRQQRWTRLSRDFEKAKHLARLIAENQYAGIGSKPYQEGLEDFLKKANRSAKRRAISRNQAYDISDAFLLEMARNNDWRCAVTGTRFDLRRLGASHGRPFAPSIDRIDSSKGYTTDNTRIVCVLTNYAMNTWGDDVFRIVAINYVKEMKKKPGFDRFEASLLASLSLKWLGTT